MDIQYVLRTLVYLQPFFWLYVLFLDNDLRGPIEHESFLKYVGIDFCLILYIYILVNDVSFGQYTSFLLSFYILMVLLCIGFFSIKYIPKDAISLSFLIVFINSYYWESMLHFNAIIFNGINFNQIVQMFHLIPAYFLVKRIEFYDNRIVKKKLLIGLFISASNTILLHSEYWIIISMVIRLSTLGILIDIVLNDIKKKEG